MPDVYEDDDKAIIEVNRRDWLIANVRPAVRELMARKGLRPEKEADLIAAVLRHPCTLLLMSSGQVEFNVDSVFDDLVRKGASHIVTRDIAAPPTTPRVTMPSEAELAKMTPVQRMAVDEKLRIQRLRDEAA